eukprot:gene13946-4904_t
MMWRVSSRSTLLMHLNDIKSMESLSEFLLQFHEGLLQGSVKQGLQSARLCGMTVSTNDVETQRIRGRILSLEYKKDENFPNNVPEIRNFMETAKNYCGFLTAWAILHGERWMAIEEDCCEKLSQLIEKLIQKRQQRWCDMLATILFTRHMYFKSLGLEDDLVANVLNCKKRFESSIGQNAPFMNRLENSIINKICRKDAKILTWLNWSVMVRQNNNLVECVAIKSTVVRNEFSEIGDKEMKSEVEKLSKNSFSQKVCFLDESKEGSSKEASDTDDMKPSKGLHGGEKPTEEATATALDQNMVTKLRSIQETVIKRLDEPLCPLDGIDPVQDILTPRSKRIYETYTPRRKEAFEKGMEWQSNQRKGRVTDASTSPSKYDFLEESQRIPTAKRNLFADGAVGIWAKCISAHHEESDQSCTLKADTPVQNVQRERRPRRETKQYGYGSKDQGGDSRKTQQLNIRTSQRVTRDRLTESKHGFAKKLMEAWQGILL